MKTKKYVPLILLAMSSMLVACGGGNSTSTPADSSSASSTPVASSSAPVSSTPAPSSTPATSSTTPSSTPVSSSEAPVSSETPISSSETPISSSESTSSEIPYAEPTITLSSEEALTVKAGEEIVLPTVSASDYLGNDLTSAIEIEDSFETGTINDGKFKANIAGVHTISYYVVDAKNGEAEKSLTITVTPTHEENFDVTDYNDPANITNYGTFKENFAKGKKSPLAKYTDSNNSASLSATEDAINGNSLIIDMNKTAGSAANSLFFNVFSDYFKRDTKVSYEVSFKYKVLTNNNNFSDCYFGLSWDGYNGDNAQFISNKEVGTTYEYSHKFPSVSIPSGGNAYFFFFKLSGSDKDCKIAIDDFTLTTTECPVTTNVIPTATELQEEAGFTWDWSTKSADISNSEAKIVNNIEDETAKAQMLASESFGTNTMKLFNADTHTFSGLTSDNLVVGKKLTLDFDFYAENKNGFCLIMMGSSGNPTLSDAVVTRVGETNIYNCHLDYTILAGQYALNIYGANNPNFAIYLGKMNAKLSEPDPIPEDTTPNGHKVGDKWTINGRQFGAGAHGDFVCSAYDDNADAIANTNMGAAPMKLSLTNVSNVTMEWFQANGKIETGAKYKITLNYYMVSLTGGDLMYNFDNQVFLPISLDTTAGYHQVSQTWDATKTVDFFSFYVAGSVTLNGSFYVGNLDIELLAINK